MMNKNPMGEALKNRRMKGLSIEISIKPDEHKTPDEEGKEDMEMAEQKKNMAKENESMVEADVEGAEPSLGDMVKESMMTGKLKRKGEEEEPRSSLSSKLNKKYG